jgi:hypothetical protein
LPDVLVFLIVLAILVLVVAVVSAPLRGARASGVEPEPAGTRESAGAGAEGTAAGIGELEAARDAKYREIRDAELDLETGKLSQADFEAIDQILRSEAIQILNALEGVREEPDGTSRHEDEPPREPDRRKPV